jgi:hypothetical protein
MKQSRRWAIAGGMAGMIDAWHKTRTWLVVSELCDWPDLKAGRVEDP